MKDSFERRLQRVHDFLDRGGFDGFTRQDLLLPAWHSIVTLSNMAETITNRFVKGELPTKDAINYLNAIVARAVHPRVNPYRRSIDRVGDLSRWGYYLEHLNICLGALGRVNPNHGFRELNTRVSEHLVENTMKYDNFHADLHARSRMKWPADQAAILYSLWLYDQNYGTNLSQTPTEGWFSYMDEHAVDQGSGLYITEVMNRKKFSKTPRGCALSYLSHYVGRFDSKRAQHIWDKYKQVFLKKTVIGVGFREYPESFKYRWTPDSGPIILGLGAAATGIGLNAASTLDDMTTYQMLEKTLNRSQSGFFGLEGLIGNTLVTRIATDLLATSIRLNAETKMKWF